jgi:hypothetical protein
LGNGGELALIELIEKLMNAIFIDGHCVTAVFFNLTCNWSRARLFEVKTGQFGFSRPNWILTPYSS